MKFSLTSLRKLLCTLLVSVMGLPIVIIQLVVITSQKYDGITLLIAILCIKMYLLPLQKNSKEVVVINHVSVKLDSFTPRQSVGSQLVVLL